MPNATIVPRAIDISAIPKDYSTRNNESTVPLIVHAPSRKSVKGTEYVLNAVNQLKIENYSFDFKLVENIPHDDAMKIYRNATIIVDQLRIGWYGVLAVEGMALGKAVVSYVRQDLRHYLPYPAPLAYATPENVVDVLRFLLENPVAAFDYGRRGRDFVNKYHEAGLVSRALSLLYSLKVKEIDPAKNALHKPTKISGGFDGGCLLKNDNYLYQAIRYDLSKMKAEAIIFYKKFIFDNPSATVARNYAKSRLRYLEN